MEITLSTILSDIKFMLPEVALVLSLCGVVLADVFLSKERSAKASALIALTGLLVAFGVVCITFGNGNHSVFTSITPNAEGTIVGITGPDYGFSRMLVSDKLSDFFKLILFLGTVGVISFSMRSPEIKAYRHGEYYTLMLGAVLGGSFLASSNNYIMLFLSLETLSLCSYVLAGYSKHNRLAAEASLKYILYGSVASGVMLFGISYIYGMGGTMDIRESLFAIPMREDNELAVLLAFVMVVGGLGFKLAAAPFHFWAPDVYQGAPTPVTAFLAVVSKAAGLSALLRIFLPLFATSGDVIPDGIQAVQGSLTSLIEQGRLPLLFWIVSASTMTIGNIIALRQNDMKRLLAYSSIAHAGYILMCMTVFNNASLEAILLYIFLYTFMNLGAFAVVMIVMNRTGSSSMSEYRGLFYRNPVLAIIMFLFLLSLTGLPPMAGFMGKMMLFYAVTGEGITASEAGNAAGGIFYFSLAAIGGINTAISLYYYMRVAKTMIFDSPKEGVDQFKVGLFDWVTLTIYAAPTALIIFFFDPIMPLVRIFERY